MKTPDGPPRSGRPSEWVWNASKLSLVLAVQPAHYSRASVDKTGKINTDF
ncbi:MAG TPA: hypothetical protein VMV04_14380 [Thermodesulfobacteriota bacterium]|nr:hypothetical protein [Thermodesulfobacteriota bacterium]